jgi:predicted NUDIX family phosphoesterase
MSVANDEKVLCFPAKILSDLGEFSGFRTKDFAKYIDVILKSKDLKFIPRSIAEGDANWKQIIPYQLLRSYNTGEYFAYRRSKNGGESRLHSKRSLGIGGHINESDDRKTGPLTFSVGRMRELFEEVKIDQATDHRAVGVIYDPSNLVGEVHFGITYTIEVEQPKVGVVDASLIEHAWVSVDDLKNEHGEFERWSQLVIDHLAATPQA